MASKQSGACPFCKNTVTAVIKEDNVIRRDKCSCPHCEKIIYVCRAPGCDHYAKGRNFYDDELCPECTRSLSSGGSDLFALAAGAVVTALVAKALEKKDQ